jgi:hypothetical protein
MLELVIKLIGLTTALIELIEKGARAYTRVRVLYRGVTYHSPGGGMVIVQKVYLYLSIYRIFLQC